MREYDLVLGLMSKQLRLVSQGALVGYARTLGSEEEHSLTGFLVEHKLVTESERDLLVRLVDSMIHANHGDIHSVLEAFGGEAAAREAFAGTIQHTKQGWGPSEAVTVQAGTLPHGLPPQILPETLGRYTRGSEYARGGIGRVLLVHDEQIGRDVILKELLPQSGVSPIESTLSRKPGDSPGTPIRHSAAMMARFLQEAKVTGQLEHPSIVPVYELGTRTDGQLYYTMKLVRGDTLAVAIKDCKSFEERLALIRPYLDVCQAMAYAHSKGVIHRDLKPSNIMVGEFGECVVLDWGLAKMQKDADAHREAMKKTVSQLRLDTDQIKGRETGSREVLGTPLYMSPEQARGDADDVAEYSDVYSLGAILYEILSGKLPHAWSNTQATIKRVGTTPAPSVVDVAPNTPPELAAICDKALSFVAAKRYPSAKELSADIRRFLEGAVVSAHSYSFSDTVGRFYRKHRALINASAAAASIVFFTGVLSYVSIFQARNAEQAARVVAEQEREEAETQRNLAALERDRAEAAEQRTALEKYVSEIRLANAYVRDYDYYAAEETLLATDPAYRNFEWTYLLAQCNRELAILKGHDKTVRAINSHNASLILTISGDRTARLWDGTTGQPLNEWRFPDSPVVDGIFSPDDALLVFWSHDGYVRVYDAVTYEALQSWRAHTLRVNKCAFNRDGTRMVSAGADKAVRIWHVGDFQLLNEIADLPHIPNHADFSHDNNRIVVCTDLDAIRLFDVETGDAGPVAKIASESMLLSGGDVTVVVGDEVVMVNDTDLSVRWRVPSYGDVTTIAGYPDVDLLLTGGSDGMLRLRQGTTGALIKSFNVNQAIISCLLSHDATRVIASTRDGVVQIHDKESGRKLEEFGGHKRGIYSMEIAPDDDYILTGSVDGVVRKWPLLHSVAYRQVAQTTGDLRPTSFSSDGRIVSLVGEDGTVRVVNLTNETTVYEASFPAPLWPAQVTLSQDGTRLGVVLDGFLAVVLGLPGGNVEATFHGHEGPIKSIRFNHDGSEILTSSWDQTARIWNGRTGELLGELAGHNDIVSDAHFSADGAWIATLSNDKTARVWDRASLTELFTIRHDASLTAAAFSPDGTQIATGDERGGVQVWNLQSQTAIKTPSGLASSVMAIDFSNDGSRLVCRDGSDALWIWDTDSGLLLADIGRDRGLNARWQQFHGPSGALLAGAQGGEILEYVPLFPVDAPPISNRAELEPRLEAYRTGRKSEAPFGGQNDSDRRANIYLSSETAHLLLEYLRVNHGGAGVPALFPALAFNDGDITTAIDDRPPASLYGGGNEAELQSLFSGNQSFKIDRLRQESLRRYTVHRLPTIHSERVISLTTEQATALLRESMKHFRHDATTIKEINDRLNAERYYSGTDNTASGFWVPNPKDGIAKALLRTAGLEHNLRIVAIGDGTVPEIDEFAPLIEAGLTRLEQNTTFTLPLYIERGLFETMDLVLQSTSN